MRSPSPLSIAAFVALATSLVRGHGHIHHVTADGKTADGANPYSGKNAKAVTRIPYKNDEPAFVLPQSFNDPSQMSCEGSANSGASSTIQVKPGGTVSMFWVGATGELNGKPGTGGLTEYNPWVHAMGPIQDYITSCNGNCADFDATNAGWTKIAGEGIDTSSAISNDLKQTMKGKPEPYHPESGNGRWAMAKFVEQGSKWDVKIPNLKAGQYIVRQELSAVHNPLVNGDSTSGPQLYIACTQIEVTDGGDLSLPAGTKSSDLYETNGDFANFNVYSGDPTKFKLPGPAVWDQVSGGSSNSGSPGSDSGSSSPSKAAESTGKADSGNNNNAVAVTSSAPASASTGSGRKCKRSWNGKRGLAISPNGKRSHMKNALKRRLADESL